jgi:hypothetical protein
MRAATGGPGTDGSSADAPAGIFTSDTCPPTSQAVTSTMTVSGTTAKDGAGVIGDHCALGSSDVHYQAIKIQIGAVKDVTATILNSSTNNHVLSMRTACTLDKGCSINKTFTKLGLDAGTYNLIIATDGQATYELKIEITDPK